MSFLGQEETVDIFECPNCKHFNSSKSENCKQCSMPFSEEQKQAAIEKTKLETKRHNIAYYKNILIVGILMFLGGGFASIVFLFLGRISFWLVIITLVGIGQVFWGVRGLIAEKKA